MRKRALLAIAALVAVAIGTAVPSQLHVGASAAAVVPADKTVTVTHVPDGGCIKDSCWFTPTE